MKLICDLSDQTFNKKTDIVDRSGYTLRRAGRAIMVNEKDEVALMWVEKAKIYKLPGGGLGENEDIHEGLKREILEETGCHASIGDVIGITVEFRDEWKLVQLSYAYKATFLSDTGTLNLDQYEKDDGFDVHWVPLDKAEELMKKHTSGEYDPKFMQIRDLKILQAFLQ